MARQESIILLRGPVDNLSFYKMNGEYFARKKSGVSGDRIRTEPAYARTRENIAEFGRASVSTKLFRETLHPFIKTIADPRVTGRLTAAMLRVIKSDAVNSQGQRRVCNGETALLKGFELNKNCMLREVFKVPYTTSIDRTTGIMTIDISTFVTTKMISAPPGATHFRLVSRGAAVDFNGNQFSASTCQSDDIAITTSEQQPLKLSLSVSASPHPMFLLLGIEFIQRIKNGTYVALNASNAMAIVDVDNNAVPVASKDIANTSKQVPSVTRVRRFLKPLVPNRKPVVSAVLCYNFLDSKTLTANIRSPDG